MVQVIHPDSFTPETDPFRVRLDFSWLDKLQMSLCFVLLFIPRIILGLFFLVLAWAVSCIGLLGLDQSKPVQGYRVTLQTISCFLGRMCCRCVGFQNVRVIGEQASRDVAPVIVVAPHSTFLDGMAVFWSGKPFIVSREENKNIPFVGKCIEFAQAIFVKREDKDARINTSEEITRRVTSGEPWGHFIIFPEGTTSNRKALMTFKTGGFRPGKVVQPLLIKYKNKHDTVSWTWDMQHGYKEIFLYTCCQWNNTAELHFLDPYVPSEEEIKDPKLFAENVRKVMADALEIPLCDMSFEDIKLKYTQKKKEE